MAKNMCTNIKLCFLILAVCATYAYAETNGPVEEVDDESTFFENTHRHREKFLKFRVYVQDITTGPNATVFDVAQASVTANSPVMFAQVRVFDNKMTVGSDPESEEIGRLQALLAFSDMNELGAVMNMNFYFKTGRFKGSTLTCVGRNPLAEYTGREMPVVGGTGVFRMARGYSISNTINFSWTGIIGGTLEYIFYVYYYDGYPLMEQSA